MPIDITNNTPLTLTLYDTFDVTYVINVGDTAMFLPTTITQVSLGLGAAYNMYPNRVSGFVHGHHYTATQGGGGVLFSDDGGYNVTFS